MRGERKKPQPARPPAEDESRRGRRELEAAQTDIQDAQVDLLRRQYRSLTGKVVHVSAPRFLLARAVLYERQIREHGDLPARVVSALAAVSREDLGPPVAPIAGSKARGPAGAPSIRPGTTFVREHQNSLHRVTALESGFSWNGRTFASLSAVARAITGVRWNGRRFFGLQAKIAGRSAKRNSVAHEANREGAGRL
jgi:hypothetical protein